jgi:hypothetical protein
MRIIAFITESVAIQCILTHMGEPAQPPPIASARGPPIQEEFDQRETTELTMNDSFPAYEFDQTASW